MFSFNDKDNCNLVRQGYKQGACYVYYGKSRYRACEITLRYKDGKIERLITSIHLSRPENYLSIYQSGCNLSCRKCHSYYFSKYYEGSWYSPEDILKVCKDYEKRVNLIEPKEKATSFHAFDTCRCCGQCVLTGKRDWLCPGKIDEDKIVLSPQGFGPVRNIVAFTGGDIMCQPDFYAKCAELIKGNTKLFVLLETNGYGLTKENLDIYKSAGVDSFWLDIKAYDDKVHKWLTGVSNEHILKLPYEIRKRGFTLEVLSLYIPGLVEARQIEAIANLLASVDPEIPFTILAFFPEYLMRSFSPPTTSQMITAYKRAKKVGLKYIRLGNLDVFAKSEEDYQRLLKEVGKEAL